MPEPPSVTPLHPPRSLSVKKPEWAGALSESQRRANANRRARQHRREHARQHAVVASWLRDLVPKG
jgi:hypothetical protein